jgi:hypothetical protein
MLNSVQFTKIRTKLDDIPFFSPCILCKSFTKEQNSNHCHWCWKYLTYTKENDVIIYNLSKFFYEISESKDSFGLSWFDFTRMEAKVIEKIQKYPFLAYVPAKLAIFIDCGNLPNGDNKISMFSQSFLEIFECICSFFNLDRDRNLDIKMTDGTFIQNFLDGFHTSKIRYMPTLKARIAVPFPFERKQLKNVLCENLNFLL